MSIQQATVFFDGWVQGVGFRFQTRSLAMTFDVVGTVENLEDGRVKLVVQGKEQIIEDYLRAIRQSRLGKHIRNEEILWGVVKHPFANFQIVG